MKHKSFAIVNLLLLFALLLSACATDQVADSQTLTHTYSGEHNEVRFEIQYPEGWEIDDSDDRRLLIERTEKVRFTLMLSEKSLDDDSDVLNSAEGLMTGMLAMYAQIYPELEYLSEPTERTIDGVLGQTMYFEAKDAQGMFGDDITEIRHVRVFTGLSDDYTYIIEANAPAEFWDSFAETFTAIEDSLKIMP